MKTCSAVLLLSVSLTLAACGGGSGGSSPVSATPTPAPSTPTPTPAPTPTPTPAPAPANLQTEEPTYSYASTSQEYAFVTALNQFRARMGLGYLNQSTQLDLAAANHLNYYISNTTVYGGSVDMKAMDPTYHVPTAHIEYQQYTGFTGAVPTDRATAAGYINGSVGEVMSGGGGHGAVPAFNTLAGTIYHRQVMMDQGSRDVGVAVGTDMSQSVVVDMGNIGTPQNNAHDYLGVYPADNQTGLQLFMPAENPNPFPDLSPTNSDFPNNTGYPISVASEASTTLSVTSFTVTEAGQAMPLSARLMTKENDPNGLVMQNVAFLVANAPFKVSTVYNVSFSGTVDGEAVAKNWSFTTGACTTYLPC